MGTAERRERDREALRMAIVEAARDLLSEKGVEGLSMRAIAERVEYSPGTLYTYFRDKDELVREVVGQGFGTLGHYFRDALAAMGPGADPVLQHRELGRAYVRFALENTAYFRVMFEIPGVARLECPRPGTEGPSMMEERPWDFVAATVQRAMDEGRVSLPDAGTGAVTAWAMVHGLASLFLSGHLSEAARTREEFEALAEAAMRSLFVGWRAEDGAESPGAAAAYGAGTAG